MNTVQTTLHETYTNFKTESQICYDALYRYLSPIVEEAVVNATSLPYELWLNNTTEFLTIYSIHLLVTTSLLVMLLFNYWSYSNQQKIIDNQQKMIDQIKDTELMVSFKLRGKLSAALDEIDRMKKQVEDSNKIVERYRALRHNKAGYFLLRGDPSNREFRQTIKSLGSDKRYVSNREYMVKLKHIGKFDNKNISV